MVAEQEAPKRQKETILGRQKQQVAKERPGQEEEIKEKEKEKKVGEEEEEEEGERARSAKEKLAAKEEAQRWLSLALLTLAP